MGVHLKYILFLNRVVMKAYCHQTLIYLSPRACRSVPICMRQEQLITDENNACAILTLIPRFTTMPTEKIILHGLYGPGILHIPLISGLSHFDSISCRALLRSLSGTAPGPLALRFSLSFSSCRTARLASCVFRSFSFRNALDSNSCQSPSRSLSLQSRVSIHF